MIKEEYTYQMPHTVLYSETDARGRLSLPSFFALFQEAALLQAEQLGFGETYCTQEGLMWVLSRLLLEVDTFPHHRDQIRIKTWPKSPRGPFANRDFLLQASDGTICARATSAWLLLNTESLRPQRPQKLFAQYTLDQLADALPEAAPKINTDETECSRELEVTARYSDLDQNDHVNNTRYVRWFLDCYTPAEIDAVEHLRFAINYLQAASYMDKVKLRRCDSDSMSTVYGYLQDDTPTFSARIQLR